MRKVLFDTNVLVDYLLGREPGCTACKRIIAMSEPGQYALYATSLSLKDAYYLVSRNLRRMERLASGSVSEGMARAVSETAWACVRQLVDMVLVVPVGRNECLDAFTLRPLHGDFEDNLVVASAREIGADYLVTGDERLLKRAPVACLRPQDLVLLLEAENTSGHRSAG